ncbi:J domain-containing protein [Laspinema olomoucense]|uniref:J domain-containing protein n=1 Tax=Laspinema olomoucense TaxID=3231600 RepID=UPI0021BBA260|nr:MULTISPECIES: DnaJ domain-containing protein [unclassified Laspinema]MCT7973283.1 DnaJ domain-containing protein [Laspinema sp. D3d]MCT7990796.1 DnaJ domain-containing protein [Laspinema sp. D3a]MCT7995462.1 DnaJ domain-containing protein [Laspinema sp. D3c]
MIDPLEAKFQAWEIEAELEQFKQMNWRSPPDAITLHSQTPPPPFSDKILRFYKILGLNSHASLKEVKQAYRALLKKCHPDLFYGHPEQQQKAQEIIQKMNEIYKEICAQMAR